MKHPDQYAINDRIGLLLKRPWTRRIKIRGLALGIALIMSFAVFLIFEDKFEIWNSQFIDRVALLNSESRAVAASRNPDVLSIDSIFYFDRSHHAQVIQNLADMRVSAQVTDFIFNDKVDAQGDGALVRATENAGNVYFGMSFGTLSENISAIRSDRNVEIGGYMKATKWQVRVSGDPDAILAGLDPRITYPELSTASNGIGFINVRPDPDGIIRRIPLLVKYNDGFYPSLSFRVVCDRLGVSPQDIIFRPGASITLTGLGGDVRQLGDRIVIPIDRQGNMLLNFAAVEAQTKKYSYREIIQASRQSDTIDALRNDLEGKIVILSETVEKPFAIRSARKDQLAPLVAIHTAVMHNIFTASFLRPMPAIATWAITMALLTLLFVLSLRFASFLVLAGAIMATGLYGGSGVFLFHSANLVFQFTRPLFVLFSFLVTLLIGLGIERALVATESERARRRAEHELEIGREIQSGFFPTTLPAVPGWEVNVHFQAARYVAGDFYDVFTLGRDGKIGLVVADVCDKGVGAALFMALFRSFIRVLSGRAVGENHLENKSNIPGILLKAFHSINNYISITHEKAAMFATVFYGIVDPVTGDLYYINGGHDPPAIMSDGRIKFLLNPTGPAVGLQPDLEYTVGHRLMAPDDILVVYTDGVIDALDRSGHPFTKRRLQKMFQQPVKSANALIALIKQDVDDHTNGVEQYDDITLMAVRRENTTPPPAEEDL